MNDAEPNCAEAVGNTIFVRAMDGIQVGVVAVKGRPVKVAEVWIAIPGNLEAVRQIVSILNGQQTVGP